MEFATAIAFILARLRAWPTLAGVRVVPFPAGDDFPAGVVVKSVVAGADVKTFDHDPIMSPIALQITAEKDAVYMDAEVVAWAKGIDDAVQNVNGQTNDYGVVFDCVRERPVNAVMEGKNGNTRQMLGGYYWLYVRGA